MARADPLDTPMMRQYLATKREHPDCLLFMRMGDFFEVFLDDAKEAARILGITLTSRNKGDEHEIPMAGVPHQSLQQHLPKLLAAGRRVAIMDQLENPAEARGLVKRGLTRIITAGTLLDDAMLEPGLEQPLVALTALDGTIGIAALDVASGRFVCEAAADQAGLALALARLQPAEVVLPRRLAEDGLTAELLAELLESDRAPPIGALDERHFVTAEARRWLTARLGVGDLLGFGIDADDDAPVAAAAAALRYADERTGAGLGHIRRLERCHPDRYLILDAHCQRNLELVRNQRDGGRADTLLASVDRTRTAAGSRLLARWLRQPLAELEALRERHRAVAALLDDDDLRRELREALARVYDLERLAGRIATGRAGGRDLVQLATSLVQAGACHSILAAADRPPLLGALGRRCAADGELAERILATLVEEPPATLGEGGLVREGVDTELDELRRIRSEAGEWLAGYQAREAERIGLRQLKVGYNKVFGYYVEIGKQHTDKVPEDYVRKQTLVAAERYITPELKDWEDRALGAEDRIRSREQALFEDLRAACADALPGLQDVATALATLDVLAGFAEQARRGGWCRPELDGGRRLELAEARHPVVEQVLGAGRFVANDCLLDADDEGAAARLVVVTGPNMAGKSTYIRQVALAVILAQAGSFVPAGACRLGLVDRVFTRIGAGDELARGMSTFMVEMAETAAILNNATDRSLVVLDEVGRGTSTFDGLALAWAITEYLHDAIGCRCLFATHYHELTELAGSRARIANRTVAVAEQDDEVVFLHRIEPGAATKSYGIHVARLAGVPGTVTGRARAVQRSLDQVDLRLADDGNASAPVGGHQLTIFGPTSHPLVDRLKAIEVDRLSPREALDLLYELHAEAGW